jgi:hypothetical protein
MDMVLTVQFNGTVPSTSWCSKFPTKLPYALHIYSTQATCPTGHSLATFLYCVTKNHKLPQYFSFLSSDIFSGTSYSKIHITTLNIFCKYFASLQAICFVNGIYLNTPFRVCPQ